MIEWLETVCAGHITGTCHVLRRFYHSIILVL